MPKHLTDQELKQRINAVAEGSDKFISVGPAGGHGEGSVELRITRDREEIWYYRYTEPGKRQRRIVIGQRNSKSGLSLAQARKAAQRFVEKYRLDPYVKEALEQQERSRKEDIEREAREAVEAEERRNSGSLKALLDAYAGKLRDEGKTSAHQVEKALKRHVLKPFPHLAGKYAADITAKEFSLVLKRLIDDGKETIATRLRAYLHAAYQWAMQSENDPTAKQDLTVFGLGQNPIAAIASLSQFNRACTRTLTWNELMEYLSRVQQISTPAIRDALLLALYLGGQRPQQILNAKLSDVHEGTITLWDTKGARTTPRAHLLPLSLKCLDLIKGAKGEYLFSVRENKPVNINTLSKAVRSISDGMLEDEKAADAFTLRDIRRTAETLLAGMGVGKDLRSQVLSHGLSGVQDRHYDKHDYMEEKKRVLERWEQAVLGEKGPDNVMPIKRFG